MIDESPKISKSRFPRIRNVMFAQIMGLL